MNLLWSEDEERLALELAKEMTYAEAAALLGRTTAAFETRLQRWLNTKRRTVTPWTEDEERLVMELSSDLTNAEIAALIGRTEAMVQGKLYALGIRPGKHKNYFGQGRRWTAEDLHILRTLGPRHRYQDIALLLKRTTESIRTMAQIVGVVKLYDNNSQEELVPPELREVIEMLEQLKKAAA